MINRWEGPFVVHDCFDNGSYQLKDMDGTLHELRVNGWRLKKYVNQGHTYISIMDKDIQENDHGEQEVDLSPSIFPN